MKRRNDNVIMSYQCKYCGNKVTVPRQLGRLRGVGHIKDMWCPFCKENSKFIEIGIY